MVELELEAIPEHVLTEIYGFLKKAHNKEEQADSGESSSEGEESPEEDGGDD